MPKAKQHDSTSAVSWQQPLYRAAIRAVDAADSTVRRVRGGELAELPPFSARIRAQGYRRQFGGKRFLAGGETTARLLKERAGLRSDERVLEIGCGAGRTALLLADYLQPGNYVGLDIDPIQVAAAKELPKLRQAKFDFQVVDVQNDIYNPNGGVSASSYRLPFEDNSFDVVFLLSVFTHLYPAECENYAAEIMRILKPGGRCAVTVFLVEGPTPKPTLAFDHAHGTARVVNPENPEKAIAFPVDELDGWFGRKHDAQHYGWWRGVTDDQYQDWLIYKK